MTVMPKISVRIDYQSIVPKLRYFYNQVKTVSGKPEFKTELNRKILESAVECGGIPRAPVETGALRDSKPYPENVPVDAIDEWSDGVPHPLTWTPKRGPNKGVERTKVHYALGWVDEHGIHWAPYSIRNGERHYYGQFVDYAPGEIIKAYSLDEEVIIQELFAGKAGLKDEFKFGVSEKNAYVIELN